MKLKNLIALMLIIIATTSCNDVKVKKNLLPGVSGSAGEVLIVLDKNYWNNTTGLYFKNLLMSDE